MEIASSKLVDSLVSRNVFATLHVDVEQLLVMRNSLIMNHEIIFLFFELISS